MKKFLLLILLLAGCKSPQLSTDITDKEAYKLYKTHLTDDAYKVLNNADSTYVLCILNDQSDKVSEPITFFIVNINEKEKVLVSINEYHSAHWIDNENLIFTVNLGAPNADKSLRKKQHKGRVEYIFNVISKKVRPLETPYDK